MNNWRTPPEVFKPLNREFVFDLDAAADCANALAPRHLHNALDGGTWPGKRIWLNPPYGKLLEPFMWKAAEEAALGKTIVALIPVRTRAEWWHEAVLEVASELRFVRKRIRFLMPNGQQGQHSPSCDSVVVVYHGKPIAPILVSSFIQQP